MQTDHWYFSCTKSGIFLPMKLIYQGKTNRCHRTGIEFSEGFNITHTKNHWSNEDKVIEHLESIIFPFAKSKRAELDLEEEQKSMLIDENHCVSVFAPAKLTHVFQQLNLTINGVANHF